MVSFFGFTQLLPWQVNCQQKLQVIEKIIEKEVPYKAGEIIKIAAEKADVKINGWNKNYIKFTLKLIARNENKEIAARELTYMKYAIGKEEGIIEFRNGFVFPQDVTSVMSSLRVVFELLVPYEGILQINEKYSE